jgi:hypothetical protein
MDRRSRSDRCWTELRKHLLEPYLCLLTLEEPLTTSQNIHICAQSVRQMCPLSRFKPVTMFLYLLLFYICLSYELSLPPPPPPPPPPPGFLLGSFFVPEDRGGIFLRNVWFSVNYMELEPERPNLIRHGISQDSNLQSPPLESQITHA